MSDSARHAAYFVQESVYGTTPASPVMTRLRHKSLTLGVQRGQLLSEELRSDRQISDFRFGAVSVAGDCGGELSFISYDGLLCAALGGQYVAKYILEGITFSAAAADDSFSDSANGFVTAGIAVGDFLEIEGFTSGGNNGVFKVATVAAGKITVTNADGTAASGIVNEVAGDSVSITAAERYLKAGTTRYSFSFLRHFSDIAAAGSGKPYHLFNGVEVNMVALSINPTAIVGVTFGLMGREGVAPSNSAPVDSTLQDPTSYSPMDAFTGALTEGGVALALVTELSLNLENGLEVRNVVGSKFTLRPSIGRCNVSGSATVFFESATMLEKFLNETESSLSVTLTDPDGNRYEIELPRIKYTAGQPDVSGQGSITLALTFQALYDEDEETNMILRSKPAAAYFA